MPNNILSYLKMSLTSLGLLFILLLGCNNNKVVKSKMLEENEVSVNYAEKELIDTAVNSKYLNQECVSQYNDPLINGVTNYQYSMYDSLNLENGFVSCLLRVDDLSNSQHMKSGLFLNMDRVPASELCFLEQLDSSVAIHVFSMRHEIIVQINRGCIYKADVINYDGQNRTTIFNPCISIARLDDSFLDKLW